MTETISIYTYTMGFKQFETSYTAAIAFLVIAILTVVVTWAMQNGIANERPALPRAAPAPLAFRYARR